MTNNYIFLKKLRYLFLISVLMFVSFSAYAQDNYKHLLILNSYGNNHKFASDIIDSVTSKINVLYDGKVVFDRVDMEVNNKLDFKINIAEYKPNVIFAIGVHATKICERELMDSLQHQNRIPLVSINALHYFPGDTKGVEYDIPARANVELISNAMPGLKEILFVDDPYNVALAASKAIEKEIKRQKLNIKYSFLPITQSNVDKVIDVILKNVPGRAIVTYDWNINFTPSSYTLHELDSLFSAKLTSPVFSLMTNDFNNDYIVGGYNYSIKMGVDKAVDQIFQLLQGEPLNMVKRESVKNLDLILNKSALKKFGISGLEKDYFEIQYVNVPPTFYQKNKLIFICSAIVLIIALLLIVSILLNYKINATKKRHIAKYKSRYSILDYIYENSNVSIAAYDDAGDKKFEYVDKLNNTDLKQLKRYIPDNLFDAKFISTQQVDNIKNKKNVVMEIESRNKKSLYKIIIKPISGDSINKLKYSLNLSVVPVDNSSDEEVERAYNVITCAADSLNIGIAYYDVVTGVGYATDIWYKNINETRSSNGMIKPDYTYLDHDTKAKIIDFKSNLVKGGKQRLFVDAKVEYSNPETGDSSVKWIKNNIIFRENPNDMGKYLVVDINFDITNQKMKDDQLSLLNKRTEESFVDSTFFIDSINHEIRTPLTSIVGFSKMLASESVSTDSGEIIKIIKKNNSLLIELVNNILTLANIDAGNYKLVNAKLNLNDVFKDLRIATTHLLGTEEYINTKDIAVKLDIPDESHFITTDDWGFRQVMLNLLSNSVKFTENGEIVFGYQVRSDGYYFFVKDTGCGIETNDCSRIFNRFEKLNIVSTGNGLGLSLCKSIIDLLHGEIGVISKVGEGSTFWFILH